MLASLVLAPRLVEAAELQPRTSLAYDAYLAEATRDFLARVEDGRVPVRPGAGGTPSAGPANEDGIVKIPGGLVHHWVARVFIPDVSLRQAIAVSTAFTAYPRVYKAVRSAQLLGHNGDRFQVMMRVSESEAGIRAVLQIVSTVEYFYPASGHAHAVSHAQEIREVKNAGAPAEQLLPAGRDSGYLWRADTLTRFLEQDGGVYVETETLGLSRQFPPLLGWIIEPIARRVGRRSAEASLSEFVDALRRAFSPI